MRNAPQKGMVKQRNMARFLCLTNHKVAESFVINVIREHELGDITEGSSAAVTEGLGWPKCWGRRHRTVPAVVCRCA
jgi:hypothetical protein